MLNIFNKIDEFLQNLEAKEEYVHRYLDATLGKMCWAPALRRRPRYRDPIKEEKGALSHASISKMPLLDVSSQEAAQLGYMVLRDDFEKVCFPTIMCISLGVFFRAKVTISCSFWSA